MGVNVGTATGYLDLDVSGFLAGLKTAQSEAQKTTDNMAQKMGSSLQGVGKSLTSAGSTLTKAVTTPVLGFGATIVKISSDFEASMSKVEAISGASGDSLQALTDKAREMGATTQFSASEAAEAFQYMAMAGWDTEEMLGGITGVMDLAAASGESLGTTSDIVTDAMTAFGMAADETSMVLKDGLLKEVDNTTRFVDVLAAASNSSNTNVAMMGETFKYVAPVAGSLGYAVEDVGVAIGLMANSGIKASQAGTSLKNIISNMANPTDKMQGAMDALGVSLTDSEGNMLSFRDVLIDLRKGFGEGHIDANEFQDQMAGLNQALADGEMDIEAYEHEIEMLTIAMYGAEGAQKAQLAAQLAGKEGMAGLLAIVGATDDDFNSLITTLDNANGTANDMANTMNDNLAGQMKELKSALEELAIQFGEVLLPVIKNGVEWLQGLVQKFQELTPEQKQQIAQWAAIAAAVGPLLLVFGKIAGSVGTLVSTFGKIPGAVSKAKAGFTKLQTAMTNVNEGFTLAKAGFPGLGAEASKLGAAFGAMSAPVVAAVTAVVAVIAVLTAAFVTLWQTNEQFRANIIAIWDGIKQKFEEFGQAVTERINALGFNFSSITEVLSAAWNAFCNLLAPAFEVAFGVVSTVLGGVLDTLIGLLDIFIGLFTGNWEQVWTGVKEVFAASWETISSLFGPIAEAIAGAIASFLEGVKQKWESIWNSIKDFFSGLWEAIKTMVKNTVDGIKNTISTVWNAIKTVTSTVWNAIKTAITNVVNGIKTTITNVWTAIKTFISTTINNIKDVLTTVWNAISTTISNVVNGIKTTVTNVWNMIKSTISSVVNSIKSTISDTFNAIWTTITDIVNNVFDTVSSVFNDIKDAMSNAVETAKENVVGAMQKAKDLVVGVWDGIKDTFTDIGGNIIQGIIDGIGGMVGKLYDSIKDALSDLVDDAKDALGIESPSKVMRDQIGKWLPPGIAVGFKSAMGRATRDMQNSLDAGMSSLQAEDINVGVGISDNIIASISMVLDYITSVEMKLANAVAGMRASLEYMIILGVAAANGVPLDYINRSGISLVQSGYNDADKGGSNAGSGGNTYVFYSTKAIDEIEAARQMKRAERDMAEGFA